jgi:hypothetical protein
MVRMSLAIPFLVLLLFGFFVYRVLAPSWPRAGRPGTSGVTAWGDGGASTGWAGESSHGARCASDSGGSDGGSCSSDSGGGSDGGGGGD